MKWQIYSCLLGKHFHNAIITVKLRFGVCVCKMDYAKVEKWVSMKHEGKMGIRPKNPLQLDPEQDKGMGAGIFFVPFHSRTNVIVVLK